MTAWAALEAGRRLDVPVIGFYHSDLPLLVSNRIGNWLGTNLNGYVTRLYSSFDRVLAPSQVMAEKLLALGVDNVFVQPLGVDLETFRPQRRDPQLRRELGLPEDTRLMIFAGRGSREKNLPILLETARQLGKPYHLLLVGSSMPHRVPDNVTVIDRFCPAAEVARLMASSDVLLHAGNQETFGLVVLEAMASGIPVVAARAGALPELVPFHAGRLCRPLDARAMAQAVQELFEDRPTLLGAQARQHVELHHAWDAVVAGLLAHYHAVLGTVELPVAVHAERAVMMVLHDVAPETWPDYRGFVERVDALGNVPMTWLVVPDFHGRNALERHPQFCSMLEGRLARGDDWCCTAAITPMTGPRRERHGSGSCAGSTPTKASSMHSTAARRAVGWRMASACSSATGGRCMGLSRRPG